MCVYRNWKLQFWDIFRAVSPRSRILSTLARTYVCTYRCVCTDPHFFATFVEIVTHKHTNAAECRGNIAHINFVTSENGILAGRGGKNPVCIRPPAPKTIWLTYSRREHRLPARNTF